MVLVSSCHDHLSLALKRALVNLPAFSSLQQLFIRSDVPLQDRDAGADLI